MKIAIFKRMGQGYSYETVHGDNYEDDEDFARLSEYVEVDFPPLSNDELVRSQLNALERTEAELRNQFQKQLDGIERSRAELLALPNLEQA